MLRLEALHLTQGDYTLTADLSIESGARVAVIGPSGAGKSTLLDLIAGFQMPDSGRVLWNGQDLAPIPPGARPVSLIFQDNNLFPHLTVAQNVGLGLRPDLKLDAAAKKAVLRSLERVGLAGLGGRKPAQLSGGQRGRVALARVLLRARPLLLLDEPFAALGPALRSEMLMLVGDLAAETGATMLMVSHDPRDAAAMADQTITVFGGRVDPPRDTATLLSDPPPALRGYLG